MAVENTFNVGDQHAQASVVCYENEIQLLLQFSMFDYRSRDFKMTKSIAIDANYVVLEFVTQFGETLKRAVDSFQGVKEPFEIRPREIERPVARETMRDDLHATCEIASGTRDVEQPQAFSVVIGVKRNFGHTISRHWQRVIYESAKWHNDNDQRVVAGDLDYSLRADHNSAASFCYAAFCCGHITEKLNPN